MTMKKILNEWRKFTINEVNQPHIDQQLGAPSGWFGKWDGKLGLLDSNEQLDAWKTYVDTNFAGALAELDEFYEPDEVDEIKNNIYGGFSFYTIEFLGGRAFKELITQKLNNYFNSDMVPQDHKDFFRDNYERIMDWGDQNTKANRAYAYKKGEGKKVFEGGVAFLGSTSDWYAFGDGFNRTLRIMEEFFSGMERGEPTPAPEFEEPAPASDAMQSRLDQMMAAIQGMYGEK